MGTSSSEGRLLADFHDGLDWLPVHLAESNNTLLAIAAGSKKHDGRAAPPVVPYWDIFLGHFCDLAWNAKGFSLKTIEMGKKSPVMVSAGFSKFFVISSPEQVQKVFRSCKQLSNKHMVVVTLQNLFGATKEVGALFDDFEIDDVKLDASPEHTTETTTTTTATASTRADNAGAQSAESSAAPRRQDGVKRLKEHVVGFRGCAQDFLSGTYLDALSKRYLANLAQATTLPNFQSCGGGGGGGGGGAAREDEEWTCYPDLYTFLQSLVSPATIEALMGSKIFEINPRIVDDFWEFERASPLFIRGLPRWLMPSKYRARDRIFDTMKKLDDLATQGGVGRLLPDDPDWEPYSGSKFLRARHDFTHFFRPYSANVKAWEKMGILFGSNANLVPTMFWYIFEALKDGHLRDRLLSEIRSCVTPSHDQTGSHRGVICYDKLLQKPLLQSAYAETLRMRVAIALPRTCETGDFDISGYRIEQNKHIMIFTWPVMRDDDAWSRAGKPPTVSFDEFWAERFLVPKQPKHPSPSIAFPSRPTTSHDEETRYEAKSSSPDYEFSVHGLAGRWMPYGGGQHLCPGRHYAKIQVLGTFAFLFHNYEIELLDSSKSRGTKMDMKWFPTGALPPDRKVPFKMRKKQDNNV